MKNIIILFLSLMTINSYAQEETDTKTIKYFEACIINESYPDDCVDHKYETDYRVIVWNDALIKSYKYSDEEFDKLGYDFVKSNPGDRNQSSKIYRNCSKGIIIEVTKWYNLKYSISIQWYAQSVRRQIGYLMFCE